MSKTTRATRGHSPEVRRSADSLHGMNSYSVVVCFYSLTDAIK